MSTEEKKALIQRAMNLINEKDYATIDQMYASSYIRHDATAPQVSNREGYKQYVMALCSIFPDLHFTIEDLLVDGEKVICRFTTAGTHSRPWRSIPATGKQVTTSGIAISRVVDNEVVEDWFINDIFGMAEQLGATFVRKEI